MKYNAIRNMVFSVLLVANVCAAADSDPSALYPHAWNLLSLNSKTIDQSLYSELKPNLTLDTNNRFYAYAGCNRIGGSFTATPPDKLEFGNSFMTKMACMNEANVEDEFVVILSQVKFWQIENNQLQLLDASRKVIATFN